MFIRAVGCKHHPAELFNVASLDFAATAHAGVGGGAREETPVPLSSWTLYVRQQTPVEFLQREHHNAQNQCRVLMCPFAFISTSP